MNPTEDISENLRYLLWEKKVDRSRWQETLAIWIGSSPERAQQLLEREPLPPRGLRRDELVHIAQETLREEEDIRHRRLMTLTGQGLLRQNFEYLVESLEHGEKRQLARRLGVDLTNIANWCRGRYGIRRKHWEGIARFFYLSSVRSLTEEPLFLSLVPAGAHAQRSHLKAYIDALDPATLQELFPALERLLKA